MCPSMLPWIPRPRRHGGTSHSASPHSASPHSASPPTARRLPFSLTPCPLPSFRPTRHRTAAALLRLWTASGLFLKLTDIVTWAPLASPAVLAARLFLVGLYLINEGGIVCQTARGPTVHCIAHTTAR